jgi:FkbM family methyltransferase
MAKMPARWMIKRPLLWLKGLAFDIFRREYQVDGMRFSIPYDMTTRIFRARFMNDTYEKAERVCVSEFVRPGMRVLELGACLGVVSGMTNKALGFSHEHVVIEANPRLIPWLTNNLQNNNCKTSVEHGLLSRSSDGTFYLHNLIVGGSNVRETPMTTTVPVFNIDDLEDKYGLKFNALIMDIEGGEQAIIDENRDWLKSIDLAIIEFHDFILGDTELMRLRTVLEDVGLARKQTRGSTEVWQRLVQ